MNRKTILVVEDETASRYFAVKTLERTGHIILSAETTDAAKRLWNSVARSIDLLIVATSRAGGVELAREFRDAIPDLKIIFMVRGGDIAEEIALLGGVTEIIDKPYTAEALIAAVKQLLNDDGSHSPWFITI